ncbi:MAG: glycolate oxidase subunit GlcF [Ectothiorhodospiraceae bacterium AqS1]|nr:glycolate oxidase subunit GlcF [Ectothiorhodospiraceae bacterium AqS1]MBF2761676.1 glycolate oxidase subunit GlcF [Ectothiorhodospiraceae bacterium AqS1]
MRTRLAAFIRDSRQGQEADAILRKCVHCGFCTATCPTYQLLADELDGPRGRIYLIKELLEGAEVSERTRTHLDRCLGCRACETTCPSGVRYARLAEIGKDVVEKRLERPLPDRLRRRLLLWLIPHRRRFAFFLGLGRLARPFLPRTLALRIPAARGAGRWPKAVHARRALALEGCVQGAAAPEIDAAAARVLDSLGISYLRMPASGCCGAASRHLGAHEEALEMMRRNIDAWWPEIEAGAEAIGISSSACAAEVKEYGHSLAHDPRYASKAERVSSLAKDLSEIVAAEDLLESTPPPQRKGAARNGGPAPPARTQSESASKPKTRQRIAFHCPCTLAHAQRLNGVVEDILKRSGFDLVPVVDSHLCCGSAGTYSILQAGISRQLLGRKIENLEAGSPQGIATANIGCLLHLRSAAKTDVRHWIELLDPDA